MIDLFRRLHPFNLLWLVLVLAALRIGVMLHLPGRLNYNLVEPFLTLQLPFRIQYIFEPIENFLCATLITLILAIWLNKLVTDHNLMGKPNFMAALMLVVCSGLFLPFTIMSRPLMANFFLLWMCMRVFQLYRSEEAKSIAYDLGLIVALGTLVYFPFLFMLIAVWAALAVFRPFSWREWVAVPIGFFTVFFFIAVLAYWNDRFDDFYRIWLPLKTIPVANFHLTTYTYILLLPVAVIVFLSFIHLREHFFKTSVFVRKVYQWLMILFVVGAASYYVQDQYKVTHFLLCIVPAAVIMAVYFSSSAIRWMYESLFVILVGVLLYFQYSNLLP
ncbi:MAG: beta-carotene 15,15'-monooxygenase [Mucilaginibacter polytrichastri]|nr:beta-carotene 15,15'-monooxygenase [Mucilaginibacter polytrichastri]